MCASLHVSQCVCRVASRDSSQGRQVPLTYMNNTSHNHCQASECKCAAKQFHGDYLWSYMSSHVGISSSPSLAERTPSNCSYTTPRGYHSNTSTPRLASEQPSWPSQHCLVTADSGRNSNQSWDGEVFMMYKDRCAGEKGSRANLTQI